MISSFFRGCAISVFGKCWFTMDWKDLFKHAICHFKKPNVYPNRNCPERLSKHRQLLQTGPENQLMVVVHLVVFLKIHHALIDKFIRLMERLTERNVVCWKCCAKFEGCWREMVVMEWAGKGCDSSIECVGARWIGLICLWMEPFHYSC